MPEPDPVATTVAAWRAAAERGDAADAAGCTADGIEIISPLTANFRFHGREQARAMLTAAFEVISDIRFHTEVGDAGTRALFYHARCGAQPVEEAQLLRFDTDGEIVELTLFMSASGPRIARLAAGKTGCPSSAVEKAC